MNAFSNPLSSAPHTEVGNSESEMNMERTVKPFIVALHLVRFDSTRTSVKCAFCNRQNHEAEKCFSSPQILTANSL